LDNTKRIRGYIERGRIKGYKRKEYLYSKEPGERISEKPIWIIKMINTIGGAI